MDPNLYLYTSTNYLIIRPEIIKFLEPSTPLLIYLLNH